MEVPLSVSCPLLTLFWVTPSPNRDVSVPWGRGGVWVLVTTPNEAMPVHWLQASLRPQFCSPDSLLPP